MIIRDDLGLIRDNASGDGGDSANRAGLMALFGSNEKLELYEISPGWLVRHPTDFPSNNPWNFTRDQLTCYVAGCWRMNKTDIVRRVFWKHVMRVGFCQDFQRDKPGTWKHPWPETYIDDKGATVTKQFDFADPLSPADFWHLILCGKMWYFYWFAIIGIPWLVLTILLYKGDEPNQLLSQCAVQGVWAKNLFKKYVVNWDPLLVTYWCGWRNQPEIYYTIRAGLNG